MPLNVSRLLLALSALVLLCSHDMFLKPNGYFLTPNQPVVVELFNGTFDLSENIIDRNRMSDISFVGSGTRSQFDTTQVSFRDSTTLLNLTTGEAGTYVLGLSTYAREIAMEAKAFNEYLEHDGVLNVLQDREADGTLEANAVERYAKHVKTLLQVGDVRTDDYKTVLGYPVEFVPLSNPYGLHPGDELRVQLLRGGEPLADQLVYLGTQTAAHTHGAETHSHGDDEAHSHGGGEQHSHGAETHSHDENAEPHSHGGTKLTTNDDGVVSFTLDDDGTYYLRTIDLIESDEEGLTHQSNWATLTFGVSHERSHDGQAHAHDHASDHGDHEHVGGIPTWGYVLGSLVIVGVLFFFFRRRV